MYSPGKASSNSHLLVLGQIANKIYGQDFIQNTFTALGIKFFNSMSVAGIMKVNYEARITKSKSWVNVWKSPVLTLMDKVTIIKSLIYFQFAYLAIQLLGRNCSLIKKIDALICNFLWGSKRDKVKREVIKRKKDEGGLGLFDFSDYLTTSMKMTIIKKILNPKFKHSWKSIFVRQFKFPGQIEVSVEL